MKAKYKKIQSFCEPDLFFIFSPLKNVIGKYRESSLSTIFGILKKSYYAKFVLVSTGCPIEVVPRGGNTFWL